MKTMIVREDSRGRNTRITARKTYQSFSGKWIAEVNRNEFRNACNYVCQGVKDCVWENLHIYADQDDDGKEYKVVTD